MAARSLDERVKILEQKVEGLQKLPARMDAVESQILQLRGEMRVGFSAIRERFDSIDRQFDETNRSMRVLHEDVVNRIALLGEGRGPRKKR